MTRTEFIKTIRGIFGIAIVVPGVIAGVSQDEDEGNYNLDENGYNKLRTMFPAGLSKDPSKISPLQEYSPKDWSGLTTKRHLGAMPNWDEQDLTVTQFLHKFDK